MVVLDGAKAPRRIYAIGDIHGCLDLLNRMIELIEEDIAAYGAEGAIVVTLGDYIDRGPASRGVLQRLARNPFSVPFIALRGNHEEMFLSFLVHPRNASGWCRQGGVETLASYSVPVSQVMIGKGYTAAAETMNWLLPEEHRSFLMSLPLAVMTPHYFLCHAGVRPGIALNQQQPNDLLWIRDEFLTSQDDFGRVVVHGHTPVTEIEVQPNRINVDTGAYRSGRLTCVVLEEAGIHSLTASL